MADTMHAIAGCRLACSAIERAPLGLRAGARQRWIMWQRSSRCP